MSSSSSPSVTPAQLIDEILETKADKPDFDLSRFVAQIDVLLAHYDAQLRKKNPIREKLGELPSASEASNFADQVSTNVKLIANQNLPNLSVLKFSTWTGRRIYGFAEIARLRSLKQLGFNGCNVDAISQCFPNLDNLQRFKLSRSADLTELHEFFFRLRSLHKLDLRGCSNLKHLPDGFGEMATLTELNLSDCSSLQELPRDLEKLTSLKSLNIAGCSSLVCLPRSLGGLMSVWGSNIDFTSCSSLSELPEEFCKHTMLTRISLPDCRRLKMLPSRFGELTCLQHLDLRGCESLQELCNDFHCLVGLRELYLNNSKSLSSLPLGFGKLNSLIKLELENCKSLSSLPLGFGELSYLETLNLIGCKSLSSLPQSFGKLSSLETLILVDCESLSSLPLDFGKLSSLKTLSLARCKSLSSLPLGFGKLSSLETLVLLGCDKLEELCSDFHCLVALKYLYLDQCVSLCNLPYRFGELGCLEVLFLAGCSNLVKLSDDFHLLQSLTRLDLSKCGSLGGEWMDSVRNIRSLWRLDIVRSERMIQRWMETKSQKERSLTVVTSLPQGKGGRALLLEGVLSNVFDEEGLLVDAYERPFHSSSLQPQTPLIFIIDSKYDYMVWEELGKHLQQLQRNSKELQIIYVGTRFKSLISKLTVKILAYTPDNARSSSFYDKLYYSFYHRGAVFRSTDRLQENGLKSLSAWEDISYILDGGESSIDLLKELLVADKMDYLLLNENRQVKIATLQGKMILLFVTFLGKTLDVFTSAVKEMYVKMQESHNYVVELVWVPIPWDNNTWEEFERAAANAPWPVVPNPWLLEKERIYSFIRGQIPCVCVVDEKGRISREDAMDMIERWGVEAYPFSEGREKELRKAEWEGFKFNSLSTLQFVFQNISNKAKEMMDRGVMILFCVGSPANMMELATRLNCALTMLEMEFQVFYVAHSHIRRINANEYDMACEKLKEYESEMCSIATLSFSDIYKFWRRVKYLKNDLLNGMGTDERIVKVRRMVLGLASAEEESWNRKKEKWEMRIVLVDGNGEILSGRGMEVVELLCHGEEDSKEKLVDDIKKWGVERNVESRWRDGIIHPKHYPHHSLLKLWTSKAISCSLCSGEFWGRIYQCNVCEKYAICKECGKSSDKR